MTTTMVADSSSAAGSEKPKVPRTRISKPKVKTGCNGCKKRRVKCDEQRPACSRCVRAGTECTGYPPPKATGIYNALLPKPPAPANIAIAPLQPRPIAIASLPAKPMMPMHNITRVPIASLNVHRPSMLPFTAQEGLYFQLFREHTASELSGFFDGSFWTRSVLQECHAAEAIRHAVVALGALYKTLDKMTESPPSSPAEVPDTSDQAEQHSEVAFRYYSYALKAMVPSNPNQDTERTSLMAHVLLACFDSFIGDHKQAIVQIQNGLGLLEKLRSERRRSFLPRPEEPVEQDLIQMFTRLAVQAKSYDMAFHFPQPYVIRLTPQGPEGGSPSSPEGGSPPVSTTHMPIPERFQSLIEARVTWDALCERVFRFTETMFSATAGNRPMGILPTFLMEYGMGFKNQITAWSNAFEPILASRNAPNKTSQEKTGIAVVKMNQIMGQILFLMTFGDSEMQFDVFVPHFQSIVNLAMEVVGDEERRAAQKRCPDPAFCRHQSSDPDIFGGHDYTARHIKPSFSADLGIVPPLYVVATKCRDRTIRRQAIQLLKTSARREGMWDSELSARIAMWITNLEEEEDGYDDAVSQASPVSNGGLSMSSPGARSLSPGEFSDDIPLGPGGNARWGQRRTSTLGSSGARPDRKSIPERKRVMVRSVEFDLRERIAFLSCGTRGLNPGAEDTRTRVTKLVW